MNADDVLRAMFADVLAPVMARMDSLERTINSKMPTRWVDRRTAAAEKGVSLPTLDRFLKEGVRDGTVRVQQFGRAIRIDAATLFPKTESEIATMARKARGA